MFVNMNFVVAHTKKIQNKAKKKKQRTKTYARVHKKEKNLVEDWVNSFYDEN